MPPILPVGEWMPDQPEFNNPGATTILNVVPQTAQSYGPMPTPTPYSTAITARAQGVYGFVDASGDGHLYAGDANRLYELNTTSAPAFNDISETTGGPYSAPSDGFWSITSFGERIIATDFADPIQTFLVGTDTKFSELSADAPRAKFGAAILDFTMVGYTYDGTDGTQPRRLWWSAIDDPTTWPTPGTNAAIQVQSDYEDLEQSDLGQLTGLIGGFLSNANGAAFCERGIYRIAYTGSPTIFDFAVAQGAAGTQSPMSIVQRRLNTGSGYEGGAYYLGEDDFYWFDGANSSPIGSQKFAKTFFKDLNPSYLAQVIGAADPINKLIFWAYTSLEGQLSPLYDRLIVYNWDLQRGALCDLSPSPIEWLGRSTSMGYTLDQLDQFGTLDSLLFPLDSRAWTGGVPILSCFDSAHRLNYTTGPALAPTVETGEKQLFPGTRALVRAGRPLVDGGVPSLALGTRDRTVDSVVYGVAVPMNVIGDCPLRGTGRYARFRISLPAASTFTHIQGVDIDAVKEGRR